MPSGGLTDSLRHILQHKGEKNALSATVYFFFFFFFSWGMSSGGQAAIKTSPSSNSCATACPLYITDNRKRQKKCGVERIPVKQECCVAKRESQTIALLPSLACPVVSNSSSSISSSAETQAAFF